MSDPKTTSYAIEVAAAVRATTFELPNEFTWFGKRYVAVPAPARGTLDPVAVRALLAGSLQWVLYANFYGRGFAAPATERPISAGGLRSHAFVEALAEANAGTGYWQQGWELVARRDGASILSRRGLTVRVDRDDLRGPPSPDSRWSVLQAKGSANLSPGYYLAFGDTELGEAEGQQLLRIYWNVDPDGAVALMRGLTAALNGDGVAFAFKVLQDLGNADRRDAAVLYVRRADYPAVAAALERIYPAIAAGLRTGSPAFTKTLAPGVGLAEDPGDGQSFGLQRCALLAEALLTAQELQPNSPDGRVQAVLGHFAAAGVSLERPYLNRDSSDDYAPLRIARACAGNTTPRVPPGRAPAEFLGVAERIGERLVPASRLAR